MMAGSAIGKIDVDYCTRSCTLILRLVPGHEIGPRAYSLASMALSSGHHRAFKEVGEEGDDGNEYMGAPAPG